MLTLSMGGAKPTFFDCSSSGKTPSYVIQVPNELLKNGVALTRRNRSLPPIPFMKNEDGSFAFEILRFFLERIRPLFPGAHATNSLFAPLNAHHEHLQEKTFDKWLLNCSSEIGLPLKSHNFRHGEASIMINDDPASVSLIAMLLGDTEGTVRKYYAFLHPEKTLVAMQKKRNARRAQHLQAASTQVAA